MTVGGLNLPQFRIS